MAVPEPATTGLHGDGWVKKTLCADALPTEPRRPAAALPVKNCDALSVEDKRAPGTADRRRPADGAGASPAHRGRSRGRRRRTADRRCRWTADGVRGRRRQLRRGSPMVHLKAKESGDGDLGISKWSNANGRNLGRGTRDRSGRSFTLGNLGHRSLMVMSL